MTDLLFQIGLSNACFALALAIVARVVGAKGRRPHLAHMLWLLVFVKLLAPPFVPIPGVTIPGRSETGVVIASGYEFDADGQPAIAETIPTSSLSSNIATAANRARPWLAAIWLLGSVVVFSWSMVRVCRFSRLLAVESEVAPQALQTAAAKMARRLKLNAIPTICTTSARFSPMVWWTGGKVRILIPTALLDQIDAQQCQWILAHELAHVRRRDYLIRWLEWLACVCFWWNPVVWWAQRNLRATEEICCDDLVISCLNPEPKLYANSLLSAVEFLARSALRPPAMASEINSGGVLERRFEMILSDKTNRSNRRWLQMCVVLLCAMFVLPLGMASAQDYEAVGKRLRAAVAAGELTGEQARAMLGALRRAGGARKEQDPDQQPDRAREYLMQVRKELGAAVEAGRISREEAVKRYQGAEEAIRERMAAGRGQARAERPQDPGRAREYLMQVRKELGAAVEAGRISREEATRRYEAAEKGIRERMAAGGRGDSKRITRADLERAAIKIRKAVAEGKISEEDGRARLQGMRKMMADRSGDRRAEYEAFERRIRAAVEAGEMTREDAREQLAGYRRRLATAERGGERDDGMVRRIAGALSDAGIEREKIRDVMGAMRRIVAEVQSEGERFELDPPMSAHLKELGLTGDQIGLVVGLARRLANRAAD